MRRPALVAVLALLVSSLSVAWSPAPEPARAAEPVCTISAKLVNSCRPWLGAESGGYGVTGFRNSMLEHEARIGRQLDIVHEYLGPGAVLPSDVVTLAKRPGTMALVNWRVSNAFASADGRSATVNAQIDNMARSIQALGETKLFLTVFHEPENDISPGGDPDCPTTPFHGSSGTTASYVDMWHNVRARFDALGVTNVVWVMNYMGWKGWHCVVKNLWPGNDYVDWVMWDPYPKTATWTTFVNMFYNFLIANNDATHDFMSKPWGLAEFGYVGSDQTAAYAMYDEIRRNLANGVHPRLKAYVVWDQHTSSSHDDRVGFDENGVRDPIEQAHYNAFANDPLMVGNGGVGPIDETAPEAAVSAPTSGATVAGTVPVQGSASDDVAVASVSLVVDSTVVATSAPGVGGAVSFSWNSTAFSNGSHTLRLRATDTAGNVGTSPAVTVTVQNATTVDRTAPTPPTGLRATAGVRQITVSWNAATDNVGVVRYHLFRDNAKYRSLGNVLTYTDTGLTSGRRYVYKVYAIDAAGNWSGSSGKVAAIAQ